MFNVTNLASGYGQSQVIHDLNFKVDKQEIVAVTRVVAAISLAMGIAFFAIGLGTTADSVDTAGALFAAYGAELVNAKGDITVGSDAVRQVLEHAQQLVKYFPADAVSYDDASNNRALIAGKTALIWNPPSAWAVAKRDAPKIAEDCWCFPGPKGPKGRFTPAGPWFWGIWSFAKNKSAAQDLVVHLMRRDAVGERVAALARWRDRLAFGDLDLPDRAGLGRQDGDLHLHRFEDHDLALGVDLVAGLGLDLPDIARDLRLHVDDGHPAARSRN